MKDNNNKKITKILVDETYKNFWQEFINHADSNPVFIKEFSYKKDFCDRKPSTRNFYHLSTGLSIYDVDLTVLKKEKWLTAGLYIREGVCMKFNRDLTDLQKELSKELGVEMELCTTRKKDARCITKYFFDIYKRETWLDGIEWLYTMSIKVKRFIEKYEKG